MSLVAIARSLQPRLYLWLNGWLKNDTRVDARKRLLSADRPGDSLSTLSNWVDVQLLSDQGSQAVGSGHRRVWNRTFNRQPRFGSEPSPSHPRRVALSGSRKILFFPACKKMINPVGPLETNVILNCLPASLSYHECSDCRRGLRRSGASARKPIGAAGVRPSRTKGNEPSPALTLKPRIEGVLMSAIPIVIASPTADSAVAALIGNEVHTVTSPQARGFRTPS